VSPDGGPTQRRPRGPGFANASVSLVMFIALLAFSLSPSRQTPPAIAEFAPQPREQITEAPDSQTSEFGSGEGGEAIIEYVGADDEEPPPPPTPPPVVEETLVPPEARTRRCVGDPPRQIEDPQSPPCVAFWDGEDNGGATYKGVTADTIRIAVPWQEAGPGQGATDRTPELVALETFFNDRFEFYGRKLQLIPFAAHGTGEPEPQLQIADAVTADEELQVFASMPRADLSGADYHYYHELARRGIVGVYSGWGTSVTEAQLRALHPYEWMIIPSSQDIAANMAEWACKNLMGRPVEYATQFNGGDRTYGLVYIRYVDGTVLDLEPFRKRAAECGIEFAAEVEIPSDDMPAGSQGAILAMQTEGVTTVFSMVQAVAQDLFLWPAASQQQYRPEWFVSSIGSATSDAAALFAPKDQLPSVFGLHYENKMQLAPDRPVNWALKEVDPSLSGDAALDKYTYWPLLILASGIQWAGPNLTPQTFGAVLQSLDFPNPGASAAPYFQATVGFRDSHAFFNDGTPVWFNPAQVSNETGQPGAFCFVDRGLRYRLGQWPDTPAALFQGPCY